MKKINMTTITKRVIKEALENNETFIDNNDSEFLIKMYYYFSGQIRKAIKNNEISEKALDKIIDANRYNKVLEAVNSKLRCYEIAEQIFVKKIGE